MCTDAAGISEQPTAGKRSSESTTPATGSPASQTLTRATSVGSNISRISNCLRPMAGDTSWRADRRCGRHFRVRYRLPQVLVGTNFGMTGPHLTPLLPSTQELALSFLMPPQAPSRDETRFHLVNPQFWAPPLYDEPALDALSFSTCSPLCTPGCCVLIVTNRDGQGTDEARSYEVFLNGKKVVSAAHSRSAQAPVNLLRSNALKVILDGGPPLQNIRFDRL